MAISVAGSEAKRVGQTDHTGFYKCLINYLYCSRPLKFVNFDNVALNKDKSQLI